MRKMRIIFRCRLLLTKYLPLRNRLHFSLQNDDIGKMCREDSTIHLVGRRLLTKDISQVDKTMEVQKSVRASTRNLAVLYIRVQDTNGTSRQGVSII